VTARPALAVALRYGLAAASVATALGTTLILRHYGFPPRFISHFTLIAIAITFWCTGTGPGLLALLLSSLGVSLLARKHFLLPGFPLESFLIFYAVFSMLMSWFSASRRHAEQLLTEARDNLEFRVAKRTDELVSDLCSRGAVRTGALQRPDISAGTSEQLLHIPCGWHGDLRHTGEAGDRRNVYRGWPGRSGSSTT
jgi:hypothetical protein